MTHTAPAAPRPAVAGPPAGAGGTLDYGPPVLLGQRQAGNNLFIDVEIGGEIHGTFDGVITEQYTVTHHGKAGFTTYLGVIDFEGVVTGADGVQREGTVTIHTRGRQDPGEPFPAAVPWHMSWVIVDGEGGLEHVQGRGTGELIVTRSRVRGSRPFRRSLTISGRWSEASCSIGALASVERPGVPQTFADLSPLDNRRHACTV